MRITLYALILLGISFTTWAKKDFTVNKDIPYLDPSAAGYDKTSHSLDVYVPHNVSGKKNKVLIFIHGGAWKGGSKDSPRHRNVGKSFAKNGIVAVVINYRVWPETKYYGMAEDCAKAFAWVEKNIEQYGGDKNEIYVSGHSAGGHLAALITTDSSYLMKEGFQSSIKGCILNDPFGLNMLQYLGQGNPVDALLFNIIFTDLPSEWKKGSPYYHIEKDNVRYYILHGGITMSTVKEQCKEFYDRNRYLNNSIEMHVVTLRSHIPMLGVFCRKNAKHLKKVVRFIKQ
ncbi:MAG: alpha/beta hydrolase [Chitinophagaceae bacterium]|nr:alpha/beta hydrolase [Chitinophagaceae bacterium]